MGGVAKHMSHIWEDLDLTFGDIKEIFTKASDGTLEAFEKVDGINSHFTVGTGSSVKFARNSTDIKGGGINLKELKIRYYNHAAENQFTQGSAAVCEFLKETWWPLGFSSKNWVNCEIVFSPQPQTIKYSGNWIILHEAAAFDTKGHKTQISLDSHFNKLVNSFGDTSVIHKDLEWNIRGPIRVQLQPTNGDGIFCEAEKGLSKILAASNLNWDSTLRDYVAVALKSGRISSLRIPEAKKQQIISLVLEEPGALRLIDIKKGLPKNIAANLSQIAVKKNRGKLISEATTPIEFVVTRFGARILENCISELVEDPSGEAVRIWSEIETARSLIETTVDGYENARAQLLESYASKLDAVDIPPVALEGIVFTHQDKKYKMTGTFAIANQILGISKYGRGGIPPIGDVDLAADAASALAVLKGMGAF